MKRLFLIFWILYVSVLSASASIITLDPKEVPGVAEYSDMAGPYVVEKEGVTMNVSYGWPGGYQYTCYEGTIDISSLDGNITRIEFTCAPADNGRGGPSSLWTTEGSYTHSETKGVWTGKSSSVRFNVSSTQLWAKLVKIWCDGSGPLRVPHIEPAGGLYYDPVNVSMWCRSDQATIHYTTDGTDPTAESPQYTAPFTLEESATVKAVAVRAGECGEVASETYDVQERVIGLAELESLPVGSYVTLKYELTVTADDYDEQFLRDETGCAVLKIDHVALSQGDVIPAGMRAVVSTIDGFTVPVIEHVKGSIRPIKYEVVEPVEITPVQTAAHLGELVVLRDVMLDPYEKTLTDRSGHSCGVYQNFVFPAVEGYEWEYTYNDHYAVVINPSCVYLTSMRTRYGLGMDYSDMPDGKEISLSFYTTAIYQHGDCMYAKDLSGYGLIKGTDLPPMATGDTYSSPNDLTKQTVDGETCLTGARFSQAPLYHDEVIPEEITLDALDHGHWAHYVLLKDVTVDAIDGQDFILTDAQGNVALGHNTFEQPLQAGHFDELTGIVGSHQQDGGEVIYWLMPIMQHDTVEVRTLAELYALPGNVIARFIEPLTVIHQDNGIELYVRDIDGEDQMVYKLGVQNYYPGDIISNASGHWSWNYAGRLIVPRGSWDVTGTTRPPKPHRMTVEEITKDHVNRYVEVKNVELYSINGSTYLFRSEDGNTLKCYNYTNAELPYFKYGTMCDVQGFVCYITNGMPNLHMLDLKEHVPDNNEPTDLNDDGETNVADINELINIIMGGNDQTQGRADVNGDGEVNIADANAILDRIFSE